MPWNVMSLNAAPVDVATLVPLPGTVAVDGAVPAPAGAEKAAAFVVDWQLGRDGKPVRRAVNGRAADLGAIER